MAHIAFPDECYGGIVTALHRNMLVGYFDTGSSYQPACIGLATTRAIAVEKKHSYFFKIIFEEMFLFLFFAVSGTKNIFISSPSQFPFLFFTLLL